MTMRLITTITVGAGGAGSIDFLNIPQDYTDLLIMTSVRTTYAANSAGLGIIPNVHLATPEYPNMNRSLQGTGTGIFSTNGSYRTSGIMPGANATSYTYESGIMLIPNYSQPGVYKVINCENVSPITGSQGEQFVGAVRTSTTNPITSLSIADATSGQNLAQYSTISLYGITKGDGGATTTAG